MIQPTAAVAAHGQFLQELLGLQLKCGAAEVAALEHVAVMAAGQVVPDLMQEKLLSTLHQVQHWKVACIDYVLQDQQAALLP